MLCELEVANLGIIDALALELGAGLTVLTGETGAGKSLLVQSLQLLAGERADAEQVRGGAEKLVVQGCFSFPHAAPAAALLEELGITRGEELVVRREVGAQGRSRAWIDDAVVTVGALQRLAPHLLAIHGQHEQRGLADPASHVALVDRAGRLEEPRGEVAEAFGAWTAVRGRLEAQRSALAHRRDRLDVITFQLSEIETARLEPGEDERLREERALLRHAERIRELLDGASRALGEEGGAVGLARAGKAVRELGGLGLDVRELSDSLDQALLLAQEAERELSRLAGRVRFDPPRLDAVEARLALVERLAHKYGGSVAAVLEYRGALAAERGELDGIEDGIAVLEEEERRLAARYLGAALGLSRRRVAAARRFCREVVKVLKSLGMPKVELELRLTRRSDPEGPVAIDGECVVPAPDGIDVGELWISANPGEAPRPMTRIASGGELSRVHLAIRTVLRDGVRQGSLTLLFDEVDAGIGGRVAEELGVLLAGLGEEDQVLVVTHLPQVACRAGTHFVVRKETSSGRTVTRVERVGGEARVDELVRMLGGGPQTPAARQHARELLQLR